MHLIYSVSNMYTLLMLLCLHVAMSVDSTWNKATVIHGWGAKTSSSKIIDDKVSYLTQMLSPAMCAHGCAQRAQCTAASYSNITRICVLYVMTNINLQREEGAEFFRFVDSRVTVLIDESLTSVAAAANMCEEVGLRLINPDQFIVAIETTNFIDCRCGWVDDPDTKYSACDSTVTPCVNQYAILAYCTPP